MPKTRIIETDGGRFMPQFKNGILPIWRLFHRNANDRHSLAFRLTERDPNKAAWFVTREDAEAFIVSVWEQSRNQEEELENSRKSVRSLRIKRVVRQARH